MSPLYGTRILLADDASTIRKLGTLILTKAGAQVITAENGLEALEHVARQPFDLVLLDMQMPVLDGYATASTLREWGLDLPIIAMTAHESDGHRMRCLEAGCSGFLCKPLEPEPLLRVVGDFATI